MARLTFDKLVTPLLLRRFELEAVNERDNPRYYALILRDDGNLVAHHPLGPQLDPAQMIWARDLLQKLNKELHHDGAWVVCFTDPEAPTFENVLAPPKHVEYGRYCLIWIDQDSDPQFTQEWVSGENADFVDFADVLLAGINSTMQKCETSWMTWRTSQDVIDHAAGQKFKRAAGERAPSSTH